MHYVHAPASGSLNATKFKERHTISDLDACSHSGDSDYLNSDSSRQEQQRNKISQHPKAFPLTGHISG